METRSNHILVGGVVLGMIAILVLFMLWLGQTGGRDKEYDIFFPSVEGLAKGAAVTFSGVPVGQIDSINLQPATPEFIRVRIKVNADTAVPIGTTATIKGVGFTGVSQIQLDPAERVPGQRRNLVELRCPDEDGSAVCPYGVPVIPPKDGGISAILNSAPELLERVSTLTERLTELLSDRNQESIAGIFDNVNVISRNLAERSDEIAATMVDARVAIRQTGDAVEEIGRLAATSDRLLAQDAGPLIGDLRQTVRAAETSMTNLDAAIADARPGLQAFSKQTIPEIGLLVQDLRAMSANLAAVSQRLETQGAGGILGGSSLPNYKGRKK